jgi:hypothetical protein
MYIRTVALAMAMWQKIMPSKRNVRNLLKKPGYNSIEFDGFDFARFFISPQNQKPYPMSYDT